MLCPRRAYSSAVATKAASIAADGKHLEGHVRLEGRNEGARIIRLDDDDEAQLAGRELEILAHDQVYEQGLKWLAGD